MTTTNDLTVEQTAQLLRRCKNLPLKEWGCRVVLGDGSGRGYYGHCDSPEGQLARICMWLARWLCKASVLRIGMCETEVVVTYCRVDHDELFKYSNTTDPTLYHAIIAAAEAVMEKERHNGKNP